MQALSWIGNLLRSERGNAMLIGAATLPLIIGAGAVGLDTIQLALWKRQLQRAADSGALAGARALAQKMPVAPAVQRDLLLNNQVPLLGAAGIEPPPAAGAYARDNKAVRVVLRSQQDLPFWSFFTGSSPILEVSSTAKLTRGGDFCMIALESGNVTAITMTGNSKLNLSCGIAANATGCPAINAKGSTEIDATAIIAVGCLDTRNNKFGDSDLLPYSDVQQDPFAERPDPSTLIAGQSCAAAFVPGNGPGCYSSMDINEALTLPPGTYYIKNGDANFGTKARVTGTGVTLVFTGDGDSIGKFDMQGQAELSLTAPTQNSGQPYYGLVMVRDASRLTMDILKINGGQELRLEGAMYFPKTKLWFNGNSDVAAQCLQIVAQQLEFKGGANIQNNCDPDTQDTRRGTFVRLVE